MKIFFLITIVASIWTQLNLQVESNNGFTYCTPVGPCRTGLCCRKLAEGLFGDVGRCESLPIEGESCGIECPCSPGLTCTTNPLCLKCGFVCMRNYIVDQLSFYLNSACFDNCKQTVFSHLFRPENVTIAREGEHCGEYAKCVDGTICSHNILCANCDHLCMHYDVVSLLLYYFRESCLRYCTNAAFSRVFIANLNPQSISVDVKGYVVFPSLN